MGATLIPVPVDKDNNPDFRQMEEIVKRIAVF